MFPRERKAKASYFHFERALAASMNVRTLYECPLMIMLFLGWMLLLFPFLSSPCSARSASLPLPEGPHALRLLQTVTFHNTNDTDIELNGFLGDVEVGALDTHAWKVKFLQPWTKSGLAPQDWDLLLKIIKGYFVGFRKTINYIALATKASYPFVVQSLIFCEIATNGAKRGFYDSAANGESLVTFSADDSTWVAQKENPMAVYTQQTLNRDKDTIAILRLLLLGQCIRARENFLQNGKEAVQRQG
ncbi:T-cell surface glycoprotein CD1b3-like isoform X2 [Rhineura floridana]|nr:T-cell surface glycoprotein CD1b3-like isoform X2 [Rhineura floridana]